MRFDKVHCVLIQKSLRFDKDRCILLKFHCLLTKSQPLRFGVIAFWCHCVLVKASTAFYLEILCEEKGFSKTAITFDPRQRKGCLSKALDASLVIIESNGTESQEQDTSSRSGNDAHVDDADIRPIYNEEPMVEERLTRMLNNESNNEGEVDQNADQCYNTHPLPAKLTNNRTIELSNQLLESKNVCLKKTVAQCQKDFAKLEAHCINLELQMENNVLKSGQQSQFLKEKSNEAKVKNDIDVTETINIELEHSVAKLLAENEQLHKEKEHLKQTYKDLFDSIKRTRVQTKDQNDSLMAQLNKKSNENADVLAQIQKKGFAIAALKNELRKLTGNSVNTKFAKPSILGKPVLQPHRNQFVVRQPTAFKSERPKISKERFASQVDVSNDLSKPVTTHYLPKRRESAPAKPHYMIATSSSRYSSNDIVHNHYLEEAKKKTQEHSRIPRNFSDTKHFVCSTCQKCVFNANHDACVIKFLKEVNSRAKVPSNKTTNRNKPVEQIRVATKPNRQIPTGHRFSIKRTSTVHEKTTSPRSCLRWQPTGRILKTVCLRWVPTGKTFASSTTKDWQVTVTGSRLLPVAGPFWGGRISHEGFLSSILLWLVIIVSVVGVGVTVVVVIIVTVVVIVESSSVIKLSFVIT
ncbi:hypothetical protein Tco_0453417 [Tanacetum coccineum]